MSFMNAVQPKQLVSKFVELKDKNSFPDGTYFFVSGTGEVNKNTSGNSFWDNSSGDVDPNLSEVVKVTYSSFWASRKVEGKDKALELKWLTNTDSEGNVVPNDPTVMLGLNNKDLNLFKRVYPTATKVMTAPKTPIPVFWFPVIKLNVTKAPKKNELAELNLSDIKHIGLSQSTFDKFLNAAKEIVENNPDESNPNMMGRIFKVEINRKAQAADMYKVSATTIFIPNLETFSTKMLNERQAIMDYIEEKTFQRVNGGKFGEEGAECVWAFICDTLSMTKQQVIAKYFVGKNQNLQAQPSEVIDLSGVEEVNESFGDE